MGLEKIFNTKLMELKVSAAQWIGVDTKIHRSILVTPVDADGTPSTSGGSSAATIADGADVAQGDKDDLAATSDVGSFNVIQLLKALVGKRRLSDNTAAPVANTFGADLVATANAAETAAAEGRLATLSIDLFRRLRTLTQGNVAAGATDTGNPVKVGGKNNTVRPTYTDGQRGDLQIAPNGSLYTSPDKMYGEDSTNDVIAIIPKAIANSGYSPTHYKDFGTVTKANVKATPGNVYSIRITNINAAVRYFQLHNKATAPVATEVPQLSFTIPAGTAAVPGVLEIPSNWLAPYENFATGIGWAISTTVGTFTDLATANEHLVNIRWL